MAHFVTISVTYGPHSKNTCKLLSPPPKKKKQSWTYWCIIELEQRLEPFKP